MVFSGVWMCEIMDAAATAAAAVAVEGNINTTTVIYRCIIRIMNDIK